MEDNMLKDRYKFGKWILLIGSIFLAAFIVHNFLF